MKQVGEDRSGTVAGHWTPVLGPIPTSVGRQGPIHCVLGSGAARAVWTSGKLRLFPGG